MGEADTRQTLFRDATQQASPRIIKRKLDEFIQSDTSHVQRTSGDVNYALEDLSQCREAVMNELPSSLPELPIRAFIKHLLPKIRLEEKTFRKICETVAEEQVYDVVTAGWPSLGESEREVNGFLEFYSSQGRIVEIAGDILGISSGIEFTSDGNKMPKSEWRGAWPDGGAGLKMNKRRESDRHWMTMFRADAFGSDESLKGKCDNFSRCIWALRHILSQDKSRRFVFGLTMVKRTVRLYFACRSFVAVSREFSICKEWEAFVRITVMFAFASEEQLGWDTTFTLTNRTPVTIKIKGKCFKIKRTINDSRAFSLLGQATRIFLAEDDEGSEVVIKDVWVDETWKREHKIQQEIFDDLDAADLSSMKMHFFEHIVFGDVPTSGHEADSTKTMCKSIDGDDLDFSKFGRLTTDLPTSTFNSSDSVGYNRSHSTSAQSIDSLNFRGAPSTVMHRVHYRLVMREVATPLRDILEVKDSMTILKHLHFLIFALAEVSWVHRDLSVTNVYFFVGDLGEPMLKLGDLEYATKFGAGEQVDSRGVRIGTRWFWSVEIEAGDFLFEPPANQARRTSVLPAEVERERRLAIKALHPEFFKLLDIPISQTEEPHDDISQTETPHDEDHTESDPTKWVEFCHNPLHELESLWWMVLYCFAMRKVSEPDVNWDEIEQRRRLDTAFPSSVNASRRDVFTRASELYTNRLQYLVLALDSSIEPLQGYLARMSRLLLNAYEEAESTLPNRVNQAIWALGPNSEGSMLYNGFAEELDALRTRPWPKFEFLGNGVKKRKTVPERNDNGGSRSSGL